MHINHRKTHEKIYQMGFFSSEDDQARVQRLLKEIREFVRKPLETACKVRSDENKEQTLEVTKQGVDTINTIAKGESPAVTPDESLESDKEHGQGNPRLGG